MSKNNENSKKTNIIIRQNHKSCGGVGERHKTLFKEMKKSLHFNHFIHRAETLEIPQCF